MSFAHALASYQPNDIKQALFSLLDETTDPEILAFDQTFNEAADKYALLAEFEATDVAQPKRQPFLLERWTHYRWIRLELMYLIHQKATFNQMTDTDSALLDSVNRAIQEDVADNISIHDSIHRLKQITLQVIGTEHPTDPLSQTARNLLLHVAQQMEEKNPDKKAIKTIFRQLQQVDAIPPTKRGVEEEVNRNISIVLDKLYDNTPSFIETILHAYREHYGEQLYQAHEDAILTAMEGDEKHPPLFRHGSWAGFDADGNTNVTPITMKYALRLHRIRAAEKHIAALESTVIQAAKKIERHIRSQISEHTKAILKKHAETNTLSSEIIDDCSYVSQCLIDRKYLELAEHSKSGHSQLAHDLVQLVAFSGTKMVDAAHQHGDLQSLQSLFSTYKENVRDQSDATQLNGKPAFEFVMEKFNETKEKHADLLKKYPALYKKTRYFGIQLHCFGMTYGVGHIRQDSSVYDNVWDTLFEDVSWEPLQGKRYLSLTEEGRVNLHKQLQNGSEDSQKILTTIFKRYKQSHYLLDEKYKKNPAFDRVRTELERVEIALANDDIIENLIISNAENAAHLLGVESLLAIFPKRPHQTPLRIVPLLEKREDLENYERILTDYMQMKAQAGDRPIIEIMVGFSDTERVSGIPALISIQQVKEDFIRLANKIGVTPKIYHGPGGDPNRGGLKRRDAKATLQGNARSNVLNTATSTSWYMQNLFYHAHQTIADRFKQMELTRLSGYFRNTLSTFKEQGTRFYEHVHDTENGLGKLTSLFLGQGAQWLVTILNSSSRATQRGSADHIGDRTASVQTNGVRPDTYVQLDKLRAITATQAKEMLRDNLDFIGTGQGLQWIGIDQATDLYHVSETFRDIVEKTLLGEATLNLSFIDHALFGDHRERILEIACDKYRIELCEWWDEVPNKLRCMDMQAMSKDPNKHDELLALLWWFVRLLEKESKETREFLFKLNKCIHPDQKKEYAKPTDLLSHAPMWKKQTKALILEVEPLNYLLARLSHHVAQGKNLDQLYPSLNKEDVSNSALSGVGRLIANVGSAITAFRQMPSGFTENGHHDYRENLRVGVYRAFNLFNHPAEAEAAALDACRRHSAA